MIFTSLYITTLLDDFQHTNFFFIYGFTDPKNTNPWVNAAVYLHMGFHLQMGFLHIPCW